MLQPASSHYNHLPKNNTIITGGHFLLTSKGPNINPGTIQSFYKAALLYSKSKEKYNNLALGILINDIGTVCSSSNSCSLVETNQKDDFTFPSEYIDILAQLNLTEKDVFIFWEKHMRNRGKKLLLKELAKKNSQLIYTNGGYTFKFSDENQILLTRLSPHDQYGSPACPLIMGAYAIEKYHMGFSSSINFYYVGKDNYLNVANHYVIEKGKHIATQLIKNIEIKNLYVFNDCVLSNFER